MMKQYRWRAETFIYFPFLKELPFFTDPPARQTLQPPLPPAIPNNYFQPKQHAFSVQLLLLVR